MGSTVRCSQARPRRPPDRSPRRRPTVRGPVPRGGGVEQEGPLMAVASTVADGIDPFDGIQIVDCDSHFTEPPDLWTSRVPSALRDSVPVQRTVDGRTAWYLDD